MIDSQTCCDQQLILNNSWLPVEAVHVVKGTAIRDRDVRIQAWKGAFEKEVQGNVASVGHAEPPKDA
jgi:hypothetical protein